MFRSTANQPASGRLMPSIRHWALWFYATLFGSRGTVARLALIDCMIVGGMSFLTVLLLGRIAGPDDLGVFALVMTVFYLLLAVQEALITMPYTVFGVRLKGVRHLQYSGAVLCQSAAWSACVSVILAIAAVTILFVDNNPHLGHIVGVFAIVLPFWTLREFGRRYLFAHMQVAKVVIMSIAGGTAQLLMICGLAYFDRLSDATALLAMGIASAISGFGWLWFSRTSFQFNHRRWSHFALKNWVFGRWVLASHAMAVVAGNTMPWLIVIWMGPSATGVFAACDAILRFANPIIASLNNVLTPRLAIGFKKGGKVELHGIVLQTTGLLCLFLFAFCLFIMIGGKWIMHRSFGSDYSGYWLALVLLAVSQLIETVALASSRALMVLDLASVNLCAEGFGLLVSLIAAIFLIPRHGILGAAFAQLAGSTALTVATVGAYLASVRDRDGFKLFSIHPAGPSPAPIGGNPD
jgi:O-antigen/teichoic acid export membrane protein